MKQLIKDALVRVGLRHPAKGVKVSQPRKAEVLLAYTTPSMTTFVETGTYDGGMIEALKPHFKEMHSIELDQARYDRAVQKFQDDKTIHLYQGDSAKEIAMVLPVLTSPTLFWLDAHAEGDITFENSPIQAELISIFSSPIRGHVIIIDDARHFNRRDIRSIRSLARSHHYKMAIAEGLFRLTPRA